MNCLSTLLSDCSISIGCDTGEGIAGAVLDDVPVVVVELELSELDERVLVLELELEELDELDELDVLVELSSKVEVGDVMLESLLLFGLILMFVCGVIGL